MNEGAKTGIYWIAAVAMLVIALFVSRSPEPEKETVIGQPLFAGFNDPLAASSLRIVTFNEEQGEIATFEVAKDEQSGVWSLPSRNNYPADAAEQMKDAANALVGVKVLDIQSENPEDHANFGVLEPNVESLEAGDEGVGRLVTFKGQNNTTLASVIVGNPVKGSEGKRYVRVRGQDPVYVVALDDKPLSTQFEDWIEKDLLQLSSIDISDVEIQNYDAALELGNQLSLERHYDAKLTIDGGNAWQLESLVEYDAQGEKKEVALAEGEKLATSKLNSLKNALDDLKIVDVAAKPKGMSENLKADKDLVSDQQAVLSLAQRGFFPVTQGDILSANGEMTVTLKDGVQYVLRFGNVKGIDESKPAEDDEAAKDKPADEPATTGSNRYLLVTTRVDDSKFPAPELAAIPKTIEELEAIEAAKAAAEAAAAAPPAAADETPPAEGDAPAADNSPEPADKEMKPAPATEPDAAATEPAEAPQPDTDAPKPADADAPAPADADADADADAPAPADAAADSPSNPEEDAPAPADDPAPEAEAADAESGDGSEGTTEQSGDGEASGTGQGQDEAPEQAADQPQAADDNQAANEAQAKADQPEEAKSVEAKSEEPKADEPKADEPKADEPKADTAAEPAQAESKEAPAAADDKVETAEEKQERLEAEQEKITKENQRKLDERKSKLEAAQRRVRELNGRFAEWYYVIPEATYRNLRLSRDELVEKPAAAGTTPNDEAATAPSFNLPPGLGQ